MDGSEMSRGDLFSKYTQMYARAKTREIVPEGAFVRQLTDIPRGELDVGLFFKGKTEPAVRQIYMGRPIPDAIAEGEGFLQTDTSTYLSRTLLSDLKDLEFLRVVIAAGELLETSDNQLNFLKKCQRIIDALVRKIRNVIHTGDITPFRFDQRVKTMSVFLSSELGLDEVAVEAASIPFTVASPTYILLTDDRFLVMNEDYKIPHGVFHLVGGMGYTFDKSVGAVQEERLFRTTTDISAYGITEPYIDRMIRSVTTDFQNNVHSIMFSDIWKKSRERPAAVNFGGDMLIKTAAESDIWSGVFEVYLRQPKTL